MRPEWLCQLKIVMTLSEIEPATSRLVAQCLNRLRHRRTLYFLIKGGKCMSIWCHIETWRCSDVTVLCWPCVCGSWSEWVRLEGRQSLIFCVQGQLQAGRAIGELKEMRAENTCYEAPRYITVGHVEINTAGRCLWCGAGKAFILALSSRNVIRQKSEMHAHLSRSWQGRQHCTP